MGECVPLSEPVLGEIGTCKILVLDKKSRCRRGASCSVVYIKNIGQTESKILLGISNNIKF